MSRAATALAVALGVAPLLLMVASLYPDQQAAWEAGRRRDALLERLRALEAEGRLGEARALVDESLAALRPAERETPASIELRFADAALRLRAGELQAAAERLRALREAAPRHAATRNALGSLAERRGDPDAAADHYAEACRLAPQVADYAANRGLLALRRGEQDLARRELRRAVALGSPRPAVTRALARLER